MVYPKAARVGNSPNQDPRKADVKQVILHHTASTGDVNDIWNMFMAANSRSVSANFLVAQDGRVFEVVNPDTGRAWTTGSGPGGTISPDHSAITMEVMDETGNPTWTISPAAQEAQAQIIAWAADRYGFTPVRGVNVRGHREMPGQSTACPGGMPLDSITARALEILAGVEPIIEEEEVEPIMAKVVWVQGEGAALRTENGWTGLGADERDLFFRVEKTKPGEYGAEFNHLQMDMMQACLRRANGEQGAQIDYNKIAAAIVAKLPATSVAFTKEELAKTVLDMQSERLKA